MVWGGQQKPPGKYALKINEKELKKLTPPTTSLQLSQLPLNTTFSRNKGSHINGDAVVGQSLVWGYMTNYAQLSRMKKLAPTLNQELQEMLQSQQKKESCWR